MSERHQEHAERHVEHHAELAAEREGRLEALQNNRPEKSGETAQERAEAAREIIHRHEQTPEPVEREAAPARHHLPQLLNPRLNYEQTLASVQRRLKPLSRGFSKLIHTPAIERTSDAVGSTIARPSVAAGSTWTALVVGLVFYFTARRYGYTLSGSELLISLVVGALLGLVLEGAWRAARRR